jgi:flavin reductase (DIM6/NTAB) family NADH-FMN oxidoreductase RutF/DNA-binding IclR family transcriptional regulator
MTSTNDVQFDQRHFRNVLGRFPTGVTVITGFDDDEPVGMIVGSFTSVSLDPPLVAFLPAKSSTTYPHIREGGRFCVNILAAGQDAVCKSFFAKSPTKFDDAGWKPSPVTGSPLIDGVVAWIDCEIDVVHEAGDHDIVVGRVLDMGVASDEFPLLFFQGGYGRFSSLSLAAWSEAESLQQMRFIELARTEMESVAQSEGLECLAIGRDGDEMMILASSGSRGDRMVPSRVGLRYPVVPPMGSLFYAFGDAAAKKEWLRMSRYGVEREDELCGVLERVRRRGWSIGLATSGQAAFAKVVDSLSPDAPTDAERAKLREVGALVDISDSEPNSLEGSDAHDIRSVSAPVFGPKGDVVFMLMAFGFRTVQLDELMRLRDRVVEAARRVTLVIGGIAPTIDDPE